jgi:tetratricopeptide (TPR) repeat protein
MPKAFLIAAAAIIAVALLAANAPAPNPQEAARLNNIGVAYMNQQLFEKALKSFEAAAAADPVLEVVTVNRGVALLNLQRLDAAKALLEQAVKTNPKEPNAWYNLGLYYKNSADSGAAVDAFRRVTEIDPADADTWYFLGSTYAQLKQFPEAIQCFDHALKLDPHHASAQFGLARAYQQSGQADPAHEAMKKFQYITQNKLGAPISLSYGEQGKYSRAEDSPVAVEKVLPQIPVRFVDVTSEAGLSATSAPLPDGDRYFYLGSGACFLDYDGDGKIDLFLADNGVKGMTLYHNLGDGKFEDVTQRSGLDPEIHAISCTAGDYDNDGASDLVVSDGSAVILYHNEKNGTFKDQTAAAGIQYAHDTNAITGLILIDYDHDGDLDLFATAGGPSNQFAKPAKAPTVVKVNPDHSHMWRNNGNGTFTDVSVERGFDVSGLNAVGTDLNNDRAVDLVVTGGIPFGAPLFLKNPREGKFEPTWGEHLGSQGDVPVGVAVLDFDHDGWMEIAFTHSKAGLTLVHNDHESSLGSISYLMGPSGNDADSVGSIKELKVNWVRSYGLVALDYDNDGWVDLAAVGETKDGRGEVRLFRNLGPDGWKDVTVAVGLDKIQLKEPRAIIAGDYDNDGAVDLLITQNHGPAVLLRNEGGNKNNSLRLALKGLNDNKSAIGTKVEVFSAGLRQKFEVYGSSGYLGQNSPYLTIGLGQAKQADVVRLLWPTGVLQDEIEVAANKVQNILELDRRGSSCPTLFAWDGHEYQLVGDMLGAGVVGHWVGAADDKGVPQGLKPVSFGVPNGTAEAVPFPKPNSDRSSKSETSSGVVRNIPRPTEAIKLDRSALRERDGKLSFRFMEPLEESVYLDEVKLLAVDHRSDLNVDPNEYFASNPPYPPFKVVFSRDARPPAGAWDEHGHDVLPDLLAHRYFGDFKVLPFLGFTEPHTLELDLGEVYQGGPLWLLMHGEIEYFSATSMYAADQAGLRPFAPYVEAQVAEKNGKSKWLRVVDDLGFPAGGARTMTADLSGKLPVGTRRIRITTNLQIYWDNILISRTSQDQKARLTPVPLARADLSFHGFPLKIEDQPPGNVKYIYEKTSATGPYTRPAGAYTRYGDVRRLLEATDDKFVVFGSGDEVALDFDPATLPALPSGWTRDYFFIANGYEKDMDFYAYHGDTVDPLPFGAMKSYPYPDQSFPGDADQVNYQLEYNTRFMSGNEATGYSFQYPQ